jgi:hypothetical protein
VEPTEPSAVPQAAAEGVGARAPLCFVIDEESSIRHFVSLILQGLGIDTPWSSPRAPSSAPRAPRTADLIILNINLDANDAILSLETLGKLGYGGAVQLMSNRGSAVLENLKHMGEQQRLRMLPVLKKPFETSAIQLGFAKPTEARVSLADALNSNWVEFWYQPKVDMKRKRLAGAELFARVRHPQHGIMMAGSFMQDADEANLVTLAEQGLVSAVKAGVSLPIQPAVAAAPAT